MSLKNIILALGIGMVCSGTLLMFVNGQKSSELSDAEIKRRAEMLGMVEPNKDAILTSELEGLEDTKNENIKKEDSKQEEEQEKEKEDQENQKNDNQKEDNQETKEKENQELNNQEINSQEKESLTENKTSSEDKTTEKDTTSKEKTSKKKVSKKKKATTSKKKKANTKQQKTEDTITVEIRSGMTAGQICQKLQEEGLVEDAEDFRKYLVKKNIQRKLQAGTFEIIKNADYDEIAKSIYRGTDI